jgi:hypothetical protein
MSTVGDRLEQAKALRDAARANFDERLALVKRDLEVRSVGGRIADRAGEEGKAVLEEAQQFAGEHRGLIAGTIAALTLWILRNPLLAAGDRLIGMTGDLAKRIKEKDSRHG